MTPDIPAVQRWNATREAAKQAFDRATRDNPGSLYEAIGCALEMLRISGKGEVRRDA